MIDFYTPQGFRIKSDGIMFTVHDPESEQELASYHPKYGDTIFGVRTPTAMVELQEALEYGRKLLSRDSNPVQCE